MAKSFSKLDQALKDLIEAYGQIEEEYSDKFAEDEESYSAAIMEVLETSIESAIEEHDASTSTFATILSVLTEALEQLDPTAFEDDEEEDDDYDADEYEAEDGDDDAELEEGDIDELDEDDDDDDDDE